jgi:hypothetical protein
MDTRAFVEELLDALAEVEEVEQVTFQAEGPVVGGRAYLQGDAFLSFYHNGETGTVAFALIKGQSRIWGIDHDSIRGWHLHPVEAPERHVVISPLSVSEVIQQLRQVLTGSWFI